MVWPVGSGLDVQHDVPEDVGERRSWGGIRVEFEDALVLVGQAELALGADHPHRGDTANLAFAELPELPRIGVEKLCAHLGECDRLSLREVRRPTNNLQRLVGAEVDRRQTESVGVGMLIDGCDATDDDVFPVAAAALD